jgi:bifunctional DNA-binding transcriptional regulator/antitoxin component of YhaV-PrlF toxin-antitoxin module
MAKRMADATKARPVPPRITRMTRNCQVTLPKPLAEAHGLGAGTLFQVDEVPEGFLFRPLTVTTPGRLAADRARAGIGLSRPFDNAKDLIDDLHRVTAQRRALASRRRKK